MKRLCVAAMMAAAGSAHAQLLYSNGSSATAGMRDILMLDVNTGVSTVWASFSHSSFSWVSSIEVAGDYLYVTDGSDLGRIHLTTKVFEYIGATGTSVSGGMAFINGTMYGTSNGSSLYTLDLNTGAASAPVVVAAGSGVTSLTLGGGATDGSLFYSSSDGTPDALVVFDPTSATPTADFVAAYPLGDTDIDALAYGNGLFWAVNDSNRSATSGQNGIYVYDPVSGTWDTTTYDTMFAGTAAGGFSAATWIPAPGSVALLGLGGLAAVRRRR